MQKWNLDNGAKEKEVSLNYQVSFVCIITKTKIKIIALLSMHTFSRKKKRRNYSIFVTVLVLRFNILR